MQHPTSEIRDATRRAGLAVAIACLGLVLAALPMFFVGGLAVQIRADLGFSEAALGGAVAASFLVGSVAGPFTGRIADRIGARQAIAIGAGLSIAALIGLAAAQGWWQLAFALAVAGVAMAMTDPGLTILLVNGVPPQRHGTALGAKEASIPAAALLAGLAIPAIALTAGWRWALVIGSIPAAGLALLLPRVPPRARAAIGTVARPEAPGDVLATRAVPTHVGPATTTGDTDDGDGRPTSSTVAVSALVLVALATALGMSAASGVGVFLTSSAVAMGLTPSGAGVLLASGSVAGIFARITMGVLADRSGGPQFGTIVVMIAGGAVTMLMATTGTTLGLVVATVGTFGAGWAWSGLLFLSLVRVMPDAPGVAAGVALAGLASGNAVGPLVFGVIAGRWSYPSAWATAAALAGASMLVMWRAGRALTGPDVPAVAK